MGVKGFCMFKVAELAEAEFASRRSAGLPLNFETDQ